mmetsp:Transcript_61561/g.178546  ORF Transcript_61561/g.178546 Transcript_61561/m.178546 type:complete len:114 (+) Transcript_61561:2232-2573(+)
MAPRTKRPLAPLGAGGGCPAVPRGAEADRPARRAPDTAAAGDRRSACAARVAAVRAMNADFFLARRGLDVLRTGSRPPKRRPFDAAVVPTFDHGGVADTRDLLPHCSLDRGGL